MLSVKEAAQFLGISASKLYQLTTARRICFYRVGGKILFAESDLASFLAGCRVEIAPVVKAQPRVRLKHLKL